MLQEGVLAEADVREAAARVESVLVDGGDAIPQGDMCEAAAVVEGALPDDAHAVPERDLRQP